MGARTALETIQAAIEKLEALKAASTPGPWRVTMNDRRTGTHAIYGELPGQEVIGATPNYGGLWLLDDGLLIVTLHRTIDAQLAILRHTLARTEAKIAHGGGFEPVWSNEFDSLALARAILGEES